MEKIEIFLKKRINQQEFLIMMIPRYFKNPNAFIGSKTYKLDDVINYEKDVKKCKAILDFLKEYNKTNK